MHSPVLAECPARRERLRTEVTGKGSFASMRAYVDEEHGVADKGLVANCAQMLSGTCLHAHMTFQMNSQVVQAQKILATYVAFQRRLLHHRALAVLLVPVQMITTMKLGTALLTHKRRVSFLVLFQ